jgi:putative salt-induced outer membrane protein YdiY
MKISSRYKKIVILLFVFSFFLQSKAQEQGTIKNTSPLLTVGSNLLYDATMSMNLGVEFKLNNKFTLKLPLTYNPWKLEDNKKYKFVLAQPELRWWFCEPFTGHFAGFYGHYAYYNVGGVGTEHMKNYRYQGFLLGAGISYGYQFYLSPRWNLETAIGIGYAYLNYDTYYCETCGEFIKNESKNYFGLTQASLSLIYIIK